MQKLHLDSKRPYLFLFQPVIICDTVIIMKILNKIIILCLFLLYVCVHGVYALEVPDHPQGPVTDLTNTLPPAEISYLNQKLADFERQTTNQIAVLLIPSLDGDSLEDYSIRLADKWRIGHKGKDNGVILLIVKRDRKLRIEVGYGLEAVLPDGLAGSIIRHKIAPFFRKGQFFEGINQGLDAIMKATNPSFVPLRPQIRVASHPQTLKAHPVIRGLFLLPFVLFAILFVILRLLSGFGYWGGGFYDRSDGGFGDGFGGGFGGFGGGFGGGGASGGW